MGYTAWSVVFGEQPSASKWNILGTNDASFNDGTGIAGFYKNLLTVDSNPYKFRARRVAAMNSSSGVEILVPYDTEDFDTNNNFDSVTNKGRYTAPVSGFYQINAKTPCVGSGGYNLAALYKNGAIYNRGNQIHAVAVISSMYCDIIQLTAGDYIEMYWRADTTSAIENGTGAQPFFSGYLMSKT